MMQIIIKQFQLIFLKFNRFVNINKNPKKIDKDIIADLSPEIKIITDTNKTVK